MFLSCIFKLDGQKLWEEASANFNDQLTISSSARTQIFLSVNMQHAIEISSIQTELFDDWKYQNGKDKQTWYSR